MCFDEHMSTILSLWQVAEDQEHNTAQLMSYLLHLMSSIGAVHLFNEVIALTQSVGFKYTVETSGRVVKHSCALSQALVPMRLYANHVAYINCLLLLPCLVRRSLQRTRVLENAFCTGRD